MDAGTQATESTREPAPEAKCVGVQAGPGIAAAAHVASQAGGAEVSVEANSQESGDEGVGGAVVADAAVQASVAPPDVGFACCQAGPSAWESEEATTQTQGPDASGNRVAEACTQTQVSAAAPSPAEAAVQTEPPPPARDSAAQTAPDDRACVVAATSQTDEPATADPAPQRTVASQTEVLQTTRRADMGTQKDDEGVKKQTSELATARDRLEVLSREASQTSQVLQSTMETEDAWRKIAQNKALGRLNVTILCPRAECVVNGDSLAVDGWNPALFKAELERDILPRFLRIFADEERPGSGGKQHGAAQATGPLSRKPDAVQRTMQEFADLFRSRLTSMLSAPNAAAAAAAANAAAAG